MAIPPNCGRQCIGIDVGGTKIEGVLLDENGSVLDTCRLPARAGSGHVVDLVVRVARSLSDTPLPVGVGVPGQVDSVTGIVRDIVNLDIVEMQMAQEVGRRLGARVHVENDVNAAALGAASVIGGQDVDGDDTIVFVNFGTGLAAGVVRNGLLEHGASGAIGEIGHIPVDPNQFPCPCGQRGCLETVASGRAVERLWPTASPPMPDLIACADEGDPHATRVLAMVMHAIGDALQIIAQAYDPRLIALGGGMSRTGQPLLDVINRELLRRSSQCHFLDTVDIPSRLRLVPPGIPVGAIGAALIVSGVAGDTLKDPLPQESKLQPVAPTCSSVG